MTLRDAVAAVAAELERDPVEPDAREVYTLDFGEGLEVEFSIHNNQLRLWAPIAPLPNDELEAKEWLHSILRSNFARMRRQWEVVSLDPTTARLVLERRLDIELIGVANLLQAVEEFLGTLEFWRATTRREEPGQPMPLLMLRP